MKVKKKTRVPVSWSDRVLRIRRKNDWSQKELADKLGCTVGSVFNWEHEKSIPGEMYQGKLNKLKG